MGYNDSTLTGFDFFAGGGGASLGLHRAGINMLAALNHSPVAIATHAVNFPGARHLLCDIRTQRSWGLGQADLMWASPDCTHHSIAKGGQSRDAKERALAEELPRFAYNLNVNCIMVENVKEFLQWGPIIERNGKMVPDPLRKGEYYRAWLASLAELGFVNYEYRLINSADFGVPQSRIRYFGIFTRRGVPICWPVATHDRHGKGGLPKWTAVRTVLDLSDKGRSIFTEWGKPIADKTLYRILAGLKKHVIGTTERQFMHKRSSNPPDGSAHKGGGLNEPTYTLATCYQPDLVTVEPARFIINPAWGGATSTAGKPSPVIVARQDKGPLSMATVYLTHYYSGGGQSSALCNPHPASTTNPHGRLITPVFLAQYNGGSDNCRVLGLDGPTNTIPTENRFGLVSMLMSYYGHGNVRPLCNPCFTLRTHDCAALLGFVTSSHGCNPPYSLNQPAKTIVASRRHNYLLLAAPGSAVADVVGDSEAMRELKAVCRENGIADIFMRMLKVSELKLIMGFPADYHLGGSATKQKEMLGNAVVPQVSEAIARAMIPSLVAARLRKLPALRRAAVNRYEQGQLFHVVAA